VLKVLINLRMSGKILTFQCRKTGRLIHAQGRMKWAVPCVALAQ